MDAPSRQPETAEDRIRRQSERLQTMLLRLAKPPKDHALADVELSQREVRLLLLLGTHPGRTMSELAAGLDAPLSTVTRMVDRLVEKGLLDRFRPEDNRRCVRVRASAKGLALHEHFERHHLEIARRMLEPLSFGEREILLELMEKLARGQSNGAARA